MMYEYGSPDTDLEFCSLFGSNGLCNSCSTLASLMSHLFNALTDTLSLSMNAARLEVLQRCKNSLTNLHQFCLTASEKDFHFSLIVAFESTVNEPNILRDHG